MKWLAVAAVLLPVAIVAGTVIGMISDEPARSPSCRSSSSTSG